VGVNNFRWDKATGNRQSIFVEFWGKCKEKGGKEKTFTPIVHLTIFGFKSG
jgi:hypothetical protein